MNPPTDPFDLKELFHLLFINIKVILITLVWLVIFVGIFIGYFSIPLILVVLLLTGITLRDKLQKRLGK